MPKMTEQEQRGLNVYVSEGCIGCHTQQVRNIEMDKTWGSRPSMPSDARLIDNKIVELV